LIKAGANPHILEQQSNVMWRAVTNKEWLLFVHIPGINGPLFTQEMNSYFQKMAEPTRFDKTYPNVNWLCFKLEGTPSGSAPLTTYGNTVNR
jgi:hypothetical protein